MCLEIFPVVWRQNLTLNLTLHICPVTFMGRKSWFTGFWLGVFPLALLYLRFDLVPQSLSGVYLDSFFLLLVILPWDTELQKAFRSFVAFEHTDAQSLSNPYTHQPLFSGTQKSGSGLQQKWRENIQWQPRYSQTCTSTWR